MLDVYITTQISVFAVDSEVKISDREKYVVRVS